MRRRRPTREREARRPARKGNAKRTSVNNPAPPEAQTDGTHAAAACIQARIKGEVARGDAKNQEEVKNLDTKTESGAKRKENAQESNSEKGVVTQPVTVGEMTVPIRKGDKGESETTEDEKSEKENEKVVEIVQTEHREPRRQVPVQENEDERKEEEEEAATKIQAGYRGAKGREKVAVMKMERDKEETRRKDAATKIQAGYRGAKGREKVAVLKERKGEVAKMQGGEVPATKERDVEASSHEQLVHVIARLSREREALEVQLEQKTRDFNIAIEQLDANAALEGLATSQPEGDAFTRDILTHVARLDTARAREHEERTEVEAEVLRLLQRVESLEAENRGLRNAPKRRYPRPKNANQVAKRIPRELRHARPQQSALQRRQHYHELVRAAEREMRVPRADASEANSTRTNSGQHTITGRRAQTSLPLVHRRAWDCDPSVRRSADVEGGFAASAPTSRPTTARSPRRKGLSTRDQEPHAADVDAMPPRPHLGGVYRGTFSSERRARAQRSKETTPRQLRSSPADAPYDGT